MEFTETYHESSLRYIGIHEYVPGVSTIEMASTLVIGEQAYRSFVGDDEVDNLRANVWVVSIDGIDEDDLKALRAVLQSDELFDDAEDWKTAHEDVERNGGLIFGTPGLLSLQFVVASLAAVASSFVFLSLVLNQRQKELAVLQAIGASPNQIIRLVLFEILSIIIVSMGLGMLLGMGLAISFNGLFEVFGFIFQIFGGSTTVIQRDLVWPWTQLGIVAISVFTAVVAALLLTTRKALGADLASVLKGE
jgi:ABC-type antimicrobial peptide transport system permease subunit